MNNPSLRLLLLVAVLFTFRRESQGRERPTLEAFTEKFVAAGQRKIQELESRNQRNERLGQAQHNQYVVYIDCLSLLGDHPSAWVGSLSAQLKDTDPALRKLDQQIAQSFDTRYNRNGDKKARFYILYVDNFPVFVGQNTNVSSYQDLKTTNKDALQQAEAQARAAVSAAIAQVYQRVVDLKQYQHWAAYAIGTVVAAKNVKGTQQTLQVAKHGFGFLESGGSGSKSQCYLQTQFSRSPVSGQPLERLSIRVGNMQQYLGDVVDQASTYRQFTCGQGDGQGGGGEMLAGLKYQVHSQAGGQLSQIQASVGKGNNPHQLKVADMRTTALFDYAGALDANQKAAALARFTANQGSNGVVSKLFILDYATPAEIRQAVDGYRKNPGANEVVMVYEFAADKKDRLDFYYGKNIKQPQDRSWLEAALVSALSGMPTSEVNPLTAILDGLAGLINVTKVPERFYNPEHQDPKTKTPDYNPVLFYVFRGSLVMTMGGHALLQEALQYQLRQRGITTTDLIGLEWAFTCGFYNGGIGMVAGIPEGASGMVKVICDPAKIGEFLAGLQKLHDECAKANPLLAAYAVVLPNGSGQPVLVSKCVWDALAKHFTTGNAYQISAKVGGAIFDVVTLVAAWMKIGKVATVLEVFDVLDSFNLLLKAGGFVCRWTSLGGKQLIKFGSGAIRLARGDKLFFEVLDATGKTLSRGSLPYTLADLPAPDGKRYAVGVLDEGNKPTRIERLLRDEKGVLVKDANGHGLAQLDNGEMALVDLDGKGFQAIASWFDRLGKVYARTKTWLSDLRGQGKIRIDEGNGQVSYRLGENQYEVFASITEGGDFVAFREVTNPVEVYELASGQAVKLRAGDANVAEGFAITKNGDGHLGCTGGFCFVAITPVWIDESGATEAISSIRTGDYLPSRSLLNSEVALKRVMATSQSRVSKLVKIYAGQDTILATLTHPFLTGDGRVLPAAWLEKGSQLKVYPKTELLASLQSYASTGSLRVDSVTRLDTVVTVYNLKVEEFGTYFVGREGFWVKDACQVIAELTGKFSNLDPKLAKRLSEVPGIGTLLGPGKDNVVRAINALPAEKRIAFFNTLLSENSMIQPASNLLGKNVDKIDEQIVSAWQILEQNGKVHKKMDFAFLNAHKTLPEEQLLIAAQKANDVPLAGLVTSGQSMLQKNLTILETTEPSMAQALLKAFEGNDRSVFSELVIAKLRALFERNHIGNKTMASQVRETMVKEFNETMGKSLSFDELMNITSKGQLDLVTQQGSRGSMFESWIEHNLGTQLGLNGKKSLVYNGKQITIDNHKIVVLADRRIIIGVELKHIDDRLQGEQLEQLKRYGELLRNNSIEIKGIEYIFSSESIAKLNENLIRLTLPTNTVKIYYIKNGILTQL
jgi:hypothetical protein